MFKLPDVEYSVETMLHGVTDGYTTESYGKDSSINHIVLDDGRKFQLDKPGNCDETRLQVGMSFIWCSKSICREHVLHSGQCVAVPFP